MIQFIKDSVRELKHVVWPTKGETRNFFFLVITLLTLFGMYLFIFSNVFSTIVFGLKDLIRGDVSVNTDAVDTSFLDDITVTASGETVEESIPEVLSEESSEPAESTGTGEEAQSE